MDAGSRQLYGFGYAGLFALEGLGDGLPIAAQERRDGVDIGRRDVIETMAGAVLVVVQDARTIVHGAIDYVHYEGPHHRGGRDAGGGVKGSLGRASDATGRGSRGRWGSEIIGTANA